MAVLKRFVLLSVLVCLCVCGFVLAASADPLSSRTLKTGMSGEDVRQVQMMLSRIGYFNGQATGYYGPVTVAAVKRFQAVNGLTADGIFGKGTAEALNRALTSNVSRSGDAEREEIQSSSADALLSYAKGFLGKPYVYGSGGPNSFDCSGFVMFVFSHAGISLPHSSSSQASIGTEVERAELTPGDLVFFNTTGRGISHVGIYVGDGSFIHASSGAGKVVITSLSDPYYNSRFVTARRIL